jgi:serine/threonine protein kinase/tetratricopeptide (TPR) repeat protein
MLFRDHARRGDELRQKGLFDKAGDAYRKAKKLDLAAEMYHQAGQLDRAVEAYKEAGLPLPAARLCEKAGFPREALALYREAKALPEAGELSFKLGLFEQAAQFFDQAKLYERAAQAFLQMGETPRALTAFERAGEELRRKRLDAGDPALNLQLRELELNRADLLIKLGRDLEAARILAQQGVVNRAAALFERAGDPSAATEALLAAGLVDEALALVERHVLVEKQAGIDPELRAEVLLNAGRHLEAAAIFEQLAKLDAAAAAYETGEAWVQAAVLFEQIGHFPRAAQLFHQVERFYDAGRCYARAGDDLRASEAFQKAGAFGNAADASLSADLPFAAGELYLRAERRQDALRALQSIEPHHPDYLRASLALLPVLLDEGLIDGAMHRYQIIKNSGHQLKRYEVLYYQGRIEEARGRYEAAESAYQKILAEKYDYRDTAERLQDVRSRIAALASSSGPLPNAAVLNATQKVMKPSAASTGPMAPAGLAPPKSRPADRDRSSGSLHALPVDIELEIEPWWEGAKFFRARDIRRKKSVLLVSLPLATVGERVKLFKEVMRQVAAVQHKSILHLEEHQVASDKVLLLYENFEGEPLALALGDHHRFTPEVSLHVLMQLCEALTTAHKLGITHQWLSPRTILISNENRCKVVGIGLREFLASHDTTSQAYLSPEVLEDGLVGPITDVFSLGLLAMELFQVSSPINWRQQKPLDPSTFQWPKRWQETIPHSIRDVLVRCLAIDPLGRPSTSEVSSALAAFGLIPGQMLVDRFEIKSELGRGGMSRVYRAQDHLADEEVAIKTLISPVGGSEDEERLRRELQICRKIVHPNVVRIYDIGRFAGGIFVHMELLNGPSLDQVIQAEAPLPPARVRKLMMEIASALSEAHRLKIVHRDLKPGNVILVDGRAKVLDFGIARMVDGSASNLTRTGEVIGSPMYMAPEQIQGLPLSGTSDLYALGVIAFALLAGREPFLGESTTAIVFKHLQEPPPDLRRFQPTLAEEWVAVVEKLLAKKSQDRYQSAEELIEALQGLT